MFLIDGVDGRPGPRVPAAVAGITFAFAAAAAAAPAPNQWARKVSACLRDACILTAAVDSDGDGVSDVDEVAAGTDPYDWRSRPGGLLLLEMAGARKLPSYAKGFTTIVVLPTTAPDGSPLFGGEFALPDRKTTLEKLGITSELLKGIDPTKGVSVEVGDSGLLLSSLGFARLSKGDSPSQTIPGTIGGLLGLSPNQGSSVTSTSVSGAAHAGTSQVNHSDGSKDFFGWQTDEKGNTRVHTNYENADGFRTGSGSYTQTSSTDANGVTTTSSQTKVETTNGSFEQTTTTTTDTDGSSYTSTETNQTTSDGEGNSTHTSSSSTTETTADGEQYTHTSTVTSDCNSKNQCTTTVTDSGGGTSCAETDCEGGSDTAYRDPDYIEVTPTAEAVATALIVLNSRLDYYHDPSNDTSEPITLPPPDPNDVSPYILVTGDDYDAPAIVDADFFYQGGVKPDYDPTLEMPLYEDPKDPDECWECRSGPS